MLQPGETTRVRFTLPASQLAFYDVKLKRFTVEPVPFEIQVGSSSEDIRLRGHVTVASAR
jgi:beta-glucosidase